MLEVFVNEETPVVETVCSLKEVVTEKSTTAQDVNEEANVQSTEEKKGNLPDDKEQETSSQNESICEREKVTQSNQEESR